MKIFNIGATDMGNDQQQIADWVLKATQGQDFAQESDFDDGEWVTKACQALNWDSVPQHGGLIVEWQDQDK